MTGTQRSSDGLDVRRRRLLYRAWHRGTRELDLLLGRFVDVHIADLDDQALDDLETLMAAPEPQLYGWLTGQIDVPENYDTALLNAIRSFYGVDGDTAGLKR